MSTYPLTPPPWADIAFHLKVGAVIYVALVLLSVALAYGHRNHFFGKLYNWYFQATHSLRVQQHLQNHIAFMHDGYIRYGFHLAVLRMFISTAICVVYVYITYVGFIGPPLLLIQKTVGVTLLIQFTGKLLVSVRPMRFIFGGESIMEVFSLASLIMATRSDWLNFSFLQAYIIILRYFTIEPTLEAVFMLKSSPFHRQLTRLTLAFIVFIYVFACGLQLFERLGEPWETLTATTFELTIANSFYFTVVTIFTVGYGDFVPFTLMGRLWIIFIIVFGAYLVSRKIGQVVDVVSGLRRGLGSFVKAEGVDHCVICGNVKWEYLKSFVQEFYGDDRNADKKLVVICDKPNWTEETWNKFFASHAHFRQNVMYLEGSCVSRDDLIRAQVETAKAVFVLNNQHNPDPYAEDSETLKRILTIRSYTPNRPIYSMCALRDSMLQITYALEHLDETEAEHDGPSRQASLAAGVNLISQMPPRSNNDMLGGPLADDISPPNLRDFSDDDEDEDGLVVPGYDGSTDLKSEAICMQEVEMSLLAENVFCNGLSTLLANLILRVNPGRKDSDQPWAVEYKIGSECRFEYVKLPMQLHNKQFRDIALIMYDYGVVLIATKTFMDNKWKSVTPDTTIHLNTVGLIITYHSTAFLDWIMKHIAEKVKLAFEEALSERSLQDVPSVDDDFPLHRDVPRHSIAGDLLTGDLSVMYEYSADEHAAQPPQYSGSHSTGEASRAVPASTSTPIPSHEEGQGTESIVTSDSASGTAPTASSAPIASSAPVVLSAPSQPAQPTAPIAAPQTPKQRPLIFTRADTARGQSSKVDVSEIERALPPLQHAPPPPHVSQENLSSGRKTESARAVGSVQLRSKAVVDTSDEFDSDVPESQTRLTRQGTDKYTEHGVELEELARVLRREVEKAMQGKAPKAENHEESPKPQVEPEEDRVAPATAPASGAQEQTTRSKRGQHHVSFPNQTQKSSSERSKLSRTKSNKLLQHRQSAEFFSSDEEDTLQIFHGEDELPMKVKGHIVVCTIGHMGVLNLKHFLQRVWTKRGQSNSEFDGRTPVVAICPRLTEEEEAELSGFSSEQLFIIQGNSLSVKTLKRAQFDQARAIVILACEDKNDVDLMDAKAIFTVMTLDYLLGEQSETFVCTMLDAEESMQLLRAPNHPRRRGAALGKEAEGYLQYGISPSILQGVSRNSITGYVGSQAATYKFLRAGRGRNRRALPQGLWGGRTLSFGAVSASGGIPQSISFVGVKNSTYTDRKEAIGRLVGIRDPKLQPGLRNISTTSFAAYRNQRDDDENIMNNPSMGGVSALNFLMNPSTMTMGGGAGLLPGEIGYGRGRDAVGHVHHGARDESFEKQRYASGEMIISSTYMALLIREYAMPGLMAVVRKIFGAGAGIGKNPRSKRCWIRTINVPQKWILASPDGKRTYRELFGVLIEHGAIALGLYRSGDVMIRVEVGQDLESSGTGSEMSVPFSDMDSRYHDETYDRFSDRSGSYRGDAFGSGSISDENQTFEIGGDSALRGSPNRSFERSALLQNLPTYGTLSDNRRPPRQSFSSDEAIDGSASGDEQPARVNIPPKMLFDMAEDVQAVQQSTEENLPDVDIGQGPAFQTYKCPTHGRTAMFRELPGGENVLPYVYTNPEAYTLVSEHDAVYVLVPPTHKLPSPEDW